MEPCLWLEQGDAGVTSGVLFMLFVSSVSLTLASWFLWRPAENTGVLFTACLLCFVCRCGHGFR